MGGLVGRRCDCELCTTSTTSGSRQPRILKSIKKFIAQEKSSQMDEGLGCARSATPTSRESNESNRPVMPFVLNKFVKCPKFGGLHALHGRFLWCPECFDLHVGPVVVLGGRGFGGHEAGAAMAAWGGSRITRMTNSPLSADDVRGASLPPSPPESRRVTSVTAGLVALDAAMDGEGQQQQRRRGRRRGKGENEVGADAGSEKAGLAAVAVVVVAVSSLDAAVCDDDERRGEQAKEQGKSEEGEDAVEGQQLLRPGWIKREGVSRGDEEGSRQRKRQGGVFSKPAWCRGEGQDQNETLGMMMDGQGRGPLPLLTRRQNKTTGKVLERDAQGKEYSRDKRLLPQLFCPVTERQMQQVGYCGSCRQVHIGQVMYANEAFVSVPIMGS